jgi:hypothetical protein
VGLPDSHWQWHAAAMILLTVHSFSEFMLHQLPEMVYSFWAARFPSKVSPQHALGL